MSGRAGLLAKVLRPIIAFALLDALLFSSPAAAGPKRFEGVEISVGVMAAPAIGNPAKAHARTWEEATGGKVTIVEYPFAELFGKFMEALTSKESSFDVLLYPSQWAGDFFPFLSEAPADMTTSEAFDDILPIYLDRLMKWEGKTISITIDGDLY